VKNQLKGESLRVRTQSVDQVSDFVLYSSYD